MGFVSDWKEVDKLLKQGPSSASRASYEISRYYSVEESRGKEQGDIVFADVKAALKIFKKYPEIQFKLRLVVGDSLQFFRLQAANNWKPEGAYMQALKNGAEFLNWMRPAVLFFLENTKGNKKLEIEIVMWDQELLKDFPADCLPPPFILNESIEAYTKRHDKWYGPYVNREYQKFVDEENRSEEFKKNQRLVFEKCANLETKENLKRAAVKYIADFEYEVSMEEAVALTLGYFHHEISNLSKSTSDILLYGISEYAKGKRPELISKTLIELVRSIWEANQISRRFILFYFCLDKTAQRNRHLVNLKNTQNEEGNFNRRKVPVGREKKPKSSKKEKRYQPQSRATAIQNYGKKYGNSAEQIPRFEQKSNKQVARTYPFDSKTYSDIKQHLEKEWLDKTKLSMERSNRKKESDQSEEKLSEDKAHVRFLSTVDRVLYKFSAEPKKAGACLKKMLDSSDEENEYNSGEENEYNSSEESDSNSGKESEQSSDSEGGETATKGFTT